MVDKPVFADEPASMGWWQRKIAGLICAAIALAIFAIILHFLQSFKEQSLRMQEEKRAYSPSPGRLETHR